ncbi:MAG: Trm112 family protein [Acidimicrobiia bacterium]
MALDAQLLSIMVCPVSHAPLREVDGWLVSTDPETRRRYQIRDGIPVMLIDESEEMSQEDWEAALGDEAGS